MDSQVILFLKYSTHTHTHTPVLAKSPLVLMSHKVVSPGTSCS